MIWLQRRGGCPSLHWPYFLRPPFKSVRGEKEGWSLAQWALFHRADFCQKFVYSNRAKSRWKTFFPLAYWTELGNTVHAGTRPSRNPVNAKSSLWADRISPLYQMAHTVLCWWLGVVLKPDILSSQPWEIVDRAAALFSMSPIIQHFEKCLLKCTGQYWYHTWSQGGLCTLLFSVINPDQWKWDFVLRDGVTLVRAPGYMVPVQQ